MAATLVLGLVRMRWSFLRERNGIPSRSLDEIPLQETNNKRKLPQNAPTEFAAKRWQPLLHDDQGKLQKPAWECALLSQLREEIRAGNLSVRHSKRFCRFDDFFIAEEQWAPLREAFFERAKLPPHDPSEVPAYLRQRLNSAYDQFLATSETNTYANGGSSTGPLYIGTYLLLRSFCPVL